MLSLKSNFPDVARAAERLREDIRNKAMASAVNKTVDQVRTLTAREIVGTYNVSSTYAKQRLRVRGASAKAGQLRLEATLIGGDGKRRSANVIAFVQGLKRAQERRRGKGGTLAQLRLKIKRGGAAKALRGAFVGNKGRTVFRRTGKERLPIEPVQTIDVGQMMMSRAVYRRIEAFALRKFPEVFEREVQFLLAKAVG